MKIDIDFATHKSFGNVNNPEIKDNFKMFEMTEQVYRANQVSIDGSIIAGFDDINGTPTVRKTINHPVGHYPNSSFIKSIHLEITAVGADEIQMQLVDTTP